MVWYKGAFHVTIISVCTGECLPVGGRERSYGYMGMWQDHFTRGQSLDPGCICVFRVFLDFNASLRLIHVVIVALGP